MDYSLLLGIEKVTDFIESPHIKRNAPFSRELTGNRQKNVDRSQSVNLDQSSFHNTSTLQNNLTGNTSTKVGKTKLLNSGHIKRDTLLATNNLLNDFEDED
jgi:hypothetical protein